jgi:hypothetical protein
MSAPLKTHVDLATLLNMPLSTVIELRKREAWPCVRLGRSVRFTDEQINQIVATHTVADAPAKPTAIAGQTARSARRRAS